MPTPHPPPLNYVPNRTFESQVDQGQSFPVLCCRMSRAPGTPQVSPTALNNCLLSECSCTSLAPGLHQGLGWPDIASPFFLPVHSSGLIWDVLSMKLFFIVLALHQTPADFRLIFCLQKCFFVFRPISTSLNSLTLYYGSFYLPHLQVI